MEKYIACLLEFYFPPIIIAFAVGCAINKNIMQYIAIYCCFMLRIPFIQLLSSPGAKES
jgi:hypothetical protein